MITCYFVGLAVFIVYITLLLVTYGIPKSISESAYLYGKPGPIIFYAGLVAVIIPTMTYWLDITSGQSYQFTVFISCTALCFTASTGKFRGDGGELQAKIHEYGTILCAVLAQLWALLSISHYWIVVLITYPLAILTGLFVKGVQRNLITGSLDKKDSVVFFVEMVSFILTFIAILIYK